MEPEGLDKGFIEDFSRKRSELLQEIHKVIIGQDDVIEELLIALFCRAHCLIVGVPGLAKTLLVRTISQILDLKFNRIQFTPDLMPSDIIGTDILEEDQHTRMRSFKFIKGPIFTNLLLADEINRTPPKTQSALLEAMQEYRVTAGGVTYDIDLPFFVLATQNPIEQEGTYPLPEAQLDRFMFNIMIDYPNQEQEIEIVRSTTFEEPVNPQKVIDGSAILKMQGLVRRIPVSDHVITYATRIVRSTRPKSTESPDFIKNWISWGCGPRAAQYLILGAKARAALQGRINVSSTDVRAMVPSVLRHRLITNFNADAEGVNVETVIARLLESVREPEERDYT
jgi:MoxR-like ATPase